MKTEDKKLEEAKEGVLEYFRKIAAVPHDSGHEGALAREMREWLKNVNGVSTIDDAGNLICDIPATPGCENAPLLMLQGHIDMVCASREGSGWDPLHDHVTLRIHPDRETGRTVLSSDGNSSLGADCGLGDAGIFWALSRAAKRGPIRVLMTVQEEVGLVGVNRLDSSALDDVKLLINVDGFAGGIIIAGSAGGRREDYSRPIHAVRETEEDAATHKRCVLKLSGFRGGHSGYDIDRGRANPIRLIGVLLRDLDDNGADFDIASFNGGLKHNVIPSWCEADIVIADKDLPFLKERAQALVSLIEEKYSVTDSEGGFSMHIYERDEEGGRLPDLVLSRGDRDAVIKFITSLHTGVYRYMKELPDHVDTSCNLGKIICDASDASKGMHALLFERSSRKEWHDELLKLHAEAAKLTGFKLSDLEEYIPWIFDHENPLMTAAAEEYERITGEKAEKSAVHVGLEPSVLGAKHPDMEMINMGADAADPHTVHERVYLDSVGPFALTLKALIERAADAKIDVEVQG